MADSNSDRWCRVTRDLHTGTVTQWQPDSNLNFNVRLGVCHATVTHFQVTARLSVAGQSPWHGAQACGTQAGPGTVTVDSEARAGNLEVSLPGRRAAGAIKSSSWSLRLAAEIQLEGAPGPAPPGTRDSRSAGRRRASLSHGQHSASTPASLKVRQTRTQTMLVRHFATRRSKFQVGCP